MKNLPFEAQIKKVREYIRQKRIPPPPSKSVDDERLQRELAYMKRLRRNNPKIQALQKRVESQKRRRSYGEE